MITAELKHNPYLLLTKVKFNGQDPRINCQIEKYEHLPLKDWVQKVPEIFYNEMNGYDFDLYFIGTKPDFEEVKCAFKEAGVSAEQVRLFHKNELEDADTKSGEIAALLTWLKDHPNRKFDYGLFREENTDLFENSYPYIIIRGDTPEKMALPVSPEVIENVDNLENTVLTSTPILFYIEEKSTAQFRKDLDLILKRPDIRQEQLFFMLHPMMNVSQATRVISDLGVDDPQVIDRYDDDTVMTFIRNYPVTEYIRSAINTFSSETDRIREILESENKESQITNREIHEQIELLEEDITALKEADENIVQRDNYVLPQTFYEVRQDFMNKISKWKNRKTKVVGDSEAEEAAEEYAAYLQKNINIFAESVSATLRTAEKGIWEELAAMYSAPGINTDFRPEGVAYKESVEMDCLDIKPSLLDLKEITYEESKNAFFGLFKKSSEESGELVQVSTCYLKQWRKRATEILMSPADDLIKDCKDILEKNYNDLAEVYHAHLLDLIGEKTKKREAVSSQLSDEERRLQEDNDWLLAFEEKLQAIERD